jgi:SAM-dependent methyltransferase
MFEWTPDVIRFRVDAVEYGGFDRAIAERILPHLPQDAHVCDAGCGLGYLSLALARHCARVTAVDVSPEALNVLRKNAQALGVINLDIAQGDLFAMRPAEKYDAMVFCFFGRVDETLRAVKAQCGGKAFLIKRNWATHRFSLTDRPVERFTFLKTCAELDEAGVKHHVEAFPLEMGQPFRSLSDAALFFQIFGREDAARVSPEDVVDRLAETGSREFPYYLPMARPLGMIVLDAGEIPDTIET